MPNKTIMVVDDSATIRKIIQRELAKADYEVILAKNGMEAMAILEWADPLPDLITLDVDMPKMNGFQVCQKIKQYAESEDPRKQETSNIPIIFVSANDTVENRERGYELEVIDFIGKPFAPGTILTAIGNILNSQEQFPDMTALVVEDSPFVRRIVRNILARHGLTIHDVENGEEALEVIKREKFNIDIVITDHIMPGMSGEELCRTLRSLEALEQVPIFFISSIDSKETILDFFRVGASDYLSKPFIEEEFRARIVTHLRNRKYVKQLEYLNYRLQYQAEHDGLTGIYNRGYFQSELGGLFAHCKHTGQELTCILMDLDFFKQVNDNFGHAFGDLVLIEFSKLLSRNRRNSDIAARYGGEEFVVLLPDTNLEDGVAIAEQIRTTAEGHIYSDGKTELQVTASFGVASLQNHNPNNPDKLLSMADAALYEAKEHGRNKVMIYSPPA